MRAIESVVVTRASADLENLKRLLCQNGFRMVALPMIETKVVRLDSTALDQITRLSKGDFDWLVFTSANGVKYFSMLLREQLGQLPVKLRVAVQGRKTRAVFEKAFGREVDLRPQTALSDALLNELVERGVRGMHILLVTPREGRNTLLALTDHGANLERLCVYETIPVKPTAEMLNEFFELELSKTVVSFYSPSAVSNFFSVFKDRSMELGKLRFASIGQVTSAAIKEAGYQAYVEAKDASDQALVQALVDSNQPR